MRKNKAQLSNKVISSLKKNRRLANKTYSTYLNWEQTLITLVQTLIGISTHSTRIFNGLIEVYDTIQNHQHSAIPIDEEEIFKALTKVSPDCTRIIVAKLEGSNFMFTDIIKAIAEQDLVGFKNVVRDNQCDLTAIEPYCNIIFHLVNFYDRLKNLGFLEDNEIRINEKDYYSFIEDVRKTIEAVFNHSHESVILSSKVGDVIEDSSNDMKSVKLVKDFIGEFIPCIYHYVRPYFSLTERQRIKPLIHKLSPNVTIPIGKLDDESFLVRVDEIMNKYMPMFSSSNGPASIIGDSIQLLGSSTEELYGDTEVSQTPIGDTCREKTSETSDSKLKNKKRINYKYKALSLKDHAPMGKSFEYNENLMKWYANEHQGNFSDFIRYVVEDKGYIEPNQKQVNAFVRTITGKNVGYDDEKATLINADKKNKAICAMLYLIKIGVIKANRYEDVFDQFNFNDNKPKGFDQRALSGKARSADRGFKESVDKFFDGFPFKTKS